MKIKNLKLKLLLTFGMAVIVLFYVIFDIPCFFLKFFNIYCAGCGMTRAWLSVLKLDFISAFKFHPMFWSVPIVYLYILFDGKLIKRGKADKILIFLIAAGFLIVWIIKILTHFL